MLPVSRGPLGKPMFKCKLTGGNEVRLALKPFKVVVCGGTFSPLHKGHMLFFEVAFKLGEKVYIGLTSDEMAKEKPLSDKIERFDERKRRLINYLEERGFIGQAEIVEINDPYGPAATEEGIEAIVVTPETLKRALEINRERRVKRGLKELVIVVIPFVRDEKGRVISSTRIRKGEITVYGEYLSNHPLLKGEDLHGGSNAKVD